MIHPNSFHTGSALVARLVQHTFATGREHPEDVIHTVLLHADGRCDYPKPFRGCMRPKGTGKRVTIRTARGTYESPPSLLNGGPDWTEKDLLDGRKTGSRSPRGTIPQRVRLTTFALWREHSKLPDLYREIVETIDREVADWLPGFGWLPTLSAIRSTAHRATDAATLLGTLKDDWTLAELRHRPHFAPTTLPAVPASKFSHACYMVDALKDAPEGNRFRTLTDDPAVLTAHEKLHARLHEWIAKVNAVLEQEQTRQGHPRGLPAPPDLEEE